jgi:hypothetical protein
MSATPPPDDDRLSLRPHPGQPPVAEYVWRPDLALALAPRPYLHPVRTLAGTPVTELMPGSHRHHLGASLAVPDVGGGNFWGGRTFLPGRGPVWLDNHGVQRHGDWLRRGPQEVAHTLRWISIDGQTLIDERRSVAARAVADDVWALDVGFSLTNATGRALPIRSPATQGRAGAGYGGFFWRAASGGRPARAYGPAGDRLPDLHGAPADWLAVAGATGGADWTLVFAGGDDGTRGDPWFVRIRDYVGVGSCLAWGRPLVVEPGQTVTRRVVTLVADGALPATRVADLLVAAGPGRAGSGR